MNSAPRTARSESGPLEHVWVRSPEVAFGGQERLDSQWQSLGYTSCPTFEAAVAEHAAFVEALRAHGAEPVFIDQDPALSIDSLYVRDASIATDSGVILCRMGKDARSGEPDAHAQAASESTLPVLGAIQEPGRLEGGDFVWLAPRVAAVGHGYRTNAEGIEQLRTLLGDQVDELIVVPLPHWQGPGDVFHLMSILSPIAADLAVVYSPLMQVPFRDRLLDLGYELVEVPDSEFDSMGANVLATGPRRVLMLDGNPVTHARLEAAGVAVTTYEGREISAKGCGGPTCLTRPLWRRADPSD